MNKDEAILKIKEQLKSLMKFSVEETNEVKEEVKMFEVIKLKDGSDISIPDGHTLDVGCEVFKIKDGVQTPLEDGEYELMDGRKISVKNNIVDMIAESVEPIKDETPATPADTTLEDVQPEVEIEAEPKVDYEERVAALEMQVSQILEILTSMSNAQNVAMSKIEAFAKLPDAEPIKIKPEVVNLKFNNVKSEIENLKEVSKKYKLTNNNYSFTAK